MVRFFAMNKMDLARKIAYENGLDEGAAADQVDRVVSQIIRSLRSGQKARLPGLGTISPGRRWTLRREVKRER